MAAIEHLPSRTASILRSTSQLPSLASILSSLIDNSLSAGSTSLHITLDLSTFTLKCKDNGTGISWDNLVELDRGGRYMTSKGFREGRGEGLISIQDVGMLQVRTRYRGDEESEWIRRGGETVELTRKRENQTRVGSRQGQGTTVTVRDIFYNFPVRRKLLSNSLSSTLSSIRSLVSTISLTHPHISFDLTDVSSLEPKTLISVKKTPEGSLGRWRQLWGRSGIENVWGFNTRAQEDGKGLRGEGFVSLSASHGKGNQFIFVNSHPLPSNSTLHKSLNTLFSRSSFSRHSSSLLSLPSPKPSSPNNSPTTRAGTGAKGRNTPKKTVEKWPIYLIDLRMPKELVEFGRGFREGDGGWIEFTDEKLVVEFVEGIAKEFLVEHGFLSETTTAGKRTRAEMEDQIAEGDPRQDDSNVSTTPQRSRSTLGTRDDSGDFEGIEQQAIKRRRISQPESQIQVPPPSRIPVEVPLAHSCVSSTPSSSPSVNPNSYPFSTTTKTWIDPTTHQAFEIDSRTGNNWRVDPVAHRIATQEAAEEEEGCERCVSRDSREVRRGIVDRRSLKRGRLGGGGNGESREGEKQMPEWLKRNLAEWENPIFPSAPLRRQHQIPSLTPTLASTQPPGTSSSKPSFPFNSSKPSLSSSYTYRKPSQAPALPTHKRLSKISSFFSTSSPSPLTSSTLLPASSISFPRESLKEAEFISQIDDKYLLVKLPLTNNDGGKGLVMFDQHAVSERIRVEKYLEGLCREEGVEVEVLEEGLGVVIGREEANGVERWRGEFEKWGFKIDPVLGTRVRRGGKEEVVEVDYVQIWIKTVPKIVKERLTTKDPKLLQELIRGYLSQLEENPPRLEGGGGGGGCREEGSGWVGRLQSCPEGLRELINSKACRGAIMFNDRLSDEQAKELLRQLAETRFPFICAHARPSIVPIVNLPVSASKGGREGDRKGEGRRKIDWNLLT